MKILFIDGENTKNRIKDILSKNYHDLDIDLSCFDFAKFFKIIEVDKIMFYAAKLKIFKESVAYSKKAVEEQRTLKRNLESNGCVFIFGGNVRRQIRGDGSFFFKEKGVDVKLATDIVEMICLKQVSEIFLMTSDSDLQPVVTISKKNDIKITYVAFEKSVNLGLLSTTDFTYKFLESTVLECYSLPEIIPSSGLEEISRKE